MSLTKNKELLVLFYSIILIFSSETLILRLSPNLFPILCSIPLIFAGQIVSKKIFFFQLLLLILGSFFYILMTLIFLI